MSIKINDWSHKVIERRQGLVIIKFWKGCACTAKKMEVIIPPGVTELNAIAAILKNL